MRTGVGEPTIGIDIEAFVA